MNDPIPDPLRLLRGRTLAVLGLALACAAALGLRAEEPKKASETFPKVVLLIRHAEKPDDDKSVHLSEQGMRRAEALPQLFVPSATRPDPFPTPDFLFATHNTHASHRPLETIKPLAKKLGLPIDDSFHNKGKDEVKDGEKGMAELAEELFGKRKYQGKTILVCWHHGTLPKLAKLLRATGYPKEWDKHRFDLVWQISYDAKGKATFLERPQHLLPGDRDK
jgi:broad specificity phosphatase PhoE